MRPNRFGWLLTMSLCAGVANAATGAPKKPSFETRFPTASPLAKMIGDQADAALQSAALGPADNETWNAAKDKTNAAFNLAIAYGSGKDLEAFREADYARRLLLQLELLENDSRKDLLKYLLAHDELSRLFAFTIRTGNNVRGVYQLLDQLRQQRPKQVEEYPNLTVALCVVRDRPLLNHINENTVQAVDPLDVFDFYIAHQQQMMYGIKDMPVDLLIYVVDTTAKMDEMNWALQKYAGTADVGHLFFTITYDYAYLEGKAPKKIDVAGFTLQNILKVGGVCVDQAYFATTVGKAIGVPTAIAGAASAEAGHAWVGYLQARGRTAEWNFDAGRYDSYRGIRGNVTDPQTGWGMADSSVSMIGDSIGTAALQRQNAVAMVDAARILLGPNGVSDQTRKEQSRYSHVDDDGSIIYGEFTVPEIPDDLPKAIKSRLTKPRSPNGDSALDLIEAGLRQYASYPAGWELVATMATKDELTEDDKKTWADLVQKLCGQKHPDFAMAVLEPMILTVKDPATQSKLWDAVFVMMKQRPDLAADVRLHQASMWHDRGDLAKAGQCYQEVVERYINAGPFALRAVAGAEHVLKEMGQSAKVLDLYARAYQLVNKPNLPMSSEFIKQSNWYKLREAYARKLDEAGQAQLAEAIRTDTGRTGSKG